jgi:hypothetical protein
MPKVGGLAVLRRALELDPDIAVVVITGHGTIEVGGGGDAGRRIRLPSQALLAARATGEDHGDALAADGRHPASGWARVCVAGGLGVSAQEIVRWDHAADGRTSL